MGLKSLFQSYSEIEECEDSDEGTYKEGSNNNGDKRNYETQRWTSGSCDQDPFFLSSHIITPKHLAQNAIQRE